MGSRPAGRDGDFGRLAPRNPIHGSALYLVQYIVSGTMIIDFARKIYAYFCPSEQFILDSKLGLEECADRLRESTTSGLAFWKSPRTMPFHGKVDVDSFDVKLREEFGTNGIPIKGRFEQSERGTRICFDMQESYAPFVVTGIFVLVIACIIYLELSKGKTGSALALTAFAGVWLYVAKKNRDGFYTNAELVAFKLMQILDAELHKDDSAPTEPNSLRHKSTAHPPTHSD